MPNHHVGQIVMFRHSDGQDYPAAITEVLEDGRVKLRVALSSGHLEVNNVALAEPSTPTRSTFDASYLARYAQGNP